MSFKNMTIEDYTTALYSKAPVPGGGGESAILGALSASLAGMVVNLTRGKKKFIKYDGQLLDILQAAEDLRCTFLELSDNDAKVFYPLSDIYKMPADTDEQKYNKDVLLQTALIDAADVPIHIMEKAGEAIALHSSLVNMCSTLAVSDVGVGVLTAKAALTSASLNVFINTALMTDEALKSSYNRKAEALLAKYEKMADETHIVVCCKLK